MLISDRVLYGCEGYVCEGKIPYNEMMKLTTRYGIMLSCGCEPPVAPQEAAFIGSDGAVLENGVSAHSAQTPF